nr:MAG TPA: hypothetical protein [Caudoviricetes sp.]
MYAVVFEKVSKRVVRGYKSPYFGSLLLLYLNYRSI